MLGECRPHRRERASHPALHSAKRLVDLQCDLGVRQAVEERQCQALTLLVRTALLHPARGVEEPRAAQPLRGFAMNHLTTVDQTQYDGAARGPFATEKERFTRGLLAFVKR